MNKTAIITGTSSGIGAAACRYRCGLECDWIISTSLSVEGVNWLATIFSENWEKTQTLASQSSARSKQICRFTTRQ